MIKKEDLRQLEQRGISVERINWQIEQFRNGFPYARLIAPATVSNGINVVSEDEKLDLIQYWREHTDRLQIVKFVPASGAATRMFKDLFEYIDTAEEGKDEEEILNREKFKGVKAVIEQLDRFAFFDALKEKIIALGSSLEDYLKQKRYSRILQVILNEEGLNYSARPKAMILFHSYSDKPRFAFEEHFIEGAMHCKMSNNIVRLHFTVSTEHRSLFEVAVSEAKAFYEPKLGVTFEVSLSEQSPSTDTIAVNLDNDLFRDKENKLVFRPAGHGALLKNLNEIDADIVFVKNIDNIVPDRLREVTIEYKELLAGMLLKTRDECHNLLKSIAEEDYQEEIYHRAYEFIKRHQICDLPSKIEHRDHLVQKVWLIEQLDRPIRVCGMVKNEGEPGGGPFLTKDFEGRISYQIIESSQISPTDEAQKQIAQAATHFNPVDLVCCLKDYQHQSFNLNRFIDPETGFISLKSKDGKDLKAMELPGLWNGAMSGWITLFVEVPVVTFNPVKTIRDLLRPNHQ